MREDTEREIEDIYRILQSSPYNFKIHTSMGYVLGVLRNGLDGKDCKRFTIAKRELKEICKTESGVRPEVVAELSVVAIGPGVYSCALILPWVVVGDGKLVSEVETVFDIDTELYPSNEHSSHTMYTMINKMERNFKKGVIEYIDYIIGNKAYDFLQMNEGEGIIADNAQLNLIKLKFLMKYAPNDIKFDDLLV